MRRLRDSHCALRRGRRGRCIAYPASRNHSTEAIDPTKGGKKEDAKSALFALSVPERSPHLSEQYPDGQSHEIKTTHRAVDRTHLGSHDEEWVLSTTSPVPRWWKIYRAAKASRTRQLPGGNLREGRSKFPKTKASKREDGERAEACLYLTLRERRRGL